MDKHIRHRLNRLVILCLLLLGAGLRFSRFGEVPPGLYHDEAQNGLDALTILNGHIPIYFAENNGREPFYIYLTAVSVGVLGRSPFAVRLPAFFIGFLTLAATYKMAYILFNEKIARFTLAVLAVTFWHIHLSRIGYRAGLLPLFTSMYVTLVIKAIRYRKTLYMMLGGVIYGLSWYTYMAVRFTPVAIAAFLIYVWTTEKQWVRNNIHQIILYVLHFILPAFLVLLPLGIYTALHPGVVLGRTSQVSIFSNEINDGHPVLIFLTHTLRTAGMFIFRGDRIWRHNLSYRPIWPGGLGLVFLIGTGVTLSGIRKNIRMGFPLVWTCVMLLPTLLAEDAPHFLRAVGVLPIVILLPALGLFWLEDRIANFIKAKSKEKNRPAILPLLSNSVPWLIILSGGLLTGYDYFVEFAQSPNTYHWFEAGPAEIAQTINSLSGQGWDGRTNHSENTNSRQVCIDPVLWDAWKAIEFLIPANSICFLPVENHPAEPGTVFVVWPYDNWRKKFGVNFPHPSYYYLHQGPLAQGDLDPEPFISSLFLYTEPLPPLPSAIAQFQNGMQLHATLVETQKDDILVKLWWTITHVQSSPSTVFVHYFRDDSVRIAQSDGQPGDDELPTTFWTPGDVIMDVHLLCDIDPDIEVDKLRIGLYDSLTGESISVIGHSDYTSPWYETNVIPIQ